MQKCLCQYVLLFITPILFAQQTQNDSLIVTEPEVAKNFEFTLMPFLNYNRNLKAMIGAVPMMMYKFDTSDSISPKSLSGVSAVYTTNGSYFFALFNKLFFAENKWRAKFFIVSGELNSQFFMDDFEAPAFYDYGTKTDLVSAGVQRKFSKGKYGGVTYTYARYDTEYSDNVLSASTTETYGLEVNALIDTRNEIYYPTKGKKVDLRWINYGKWLGNELIANKLQVAYNQYMPMRSGIDVLATRFSGIFSIGDIAFEQQQTIGGKDIRGYSKGKYRGDGLVALQGEYRYNFNARMGVVGFAGLSTIYGSENEAFNWKLYPGLGAGYRYRAFKDTKFNIGVDAAVGKEDWGIYFRIGEAF